MGSKAIAKRLENVLPNILYIVTNNALMSKEGQSSIQLERLKMLWNFHHLSVTFQWIHTFTTKSRLVSFTMIFLLSPLQLKEL